MSYYFEGCPQLSDNSSYVLTPDCFVVKYFNDDEKRKTIQFTLNCLTPSYSTVPFFHSHESFLYAIFVY